MAAAVLTVPAVPEQARAARLVAGAAARRAGVDPESLDDVRLAVAEAVARAVLRSMADRSPESATVTVVMTDGPDDFEVAVTDSADVPGDESADDEELALSVMRSLASDSRVEPRPEGGRTIVLAWPAALPR
ncbi:MAG: ATP-binding protein [Candidatus Nanopelagicales bacterium]